MGHPDTTRAAPVHRRPLSGTFQACYKRVNFHLRVHMGACDRHAGMGAFHARFMHLGHGNGESPFGFWYFRRQERPFRLCE